MADRTIDQTSVGIVGRSGAVVELTEQDSIKISTKSNTHVEVFSDGQIIVSGSNIYFDTNQDKQYSIVNGEELVKILSWLIEQMKTHSHGPNSPAVPNFHTRANSILNNIETLLLNETIKHG